MANSNGVVFPGLTYRYVSTNIQRIAGKVFAKGEIVDSRIFAIAERVAQMTALWDAGLIVMAGDDDRPLSLAEMLEVLRVSINEADAATTELDEVKETTIAVRDETDAARVAIQQTATDLLASAPNAAASETAAEQWAAIAQTAAAPAQYITSVIVQSAATDAAEYRTDPYGLIFGKTFGDGTDYSAAIQPGSLSVTGIATLPTITRGGIVESVVQSADAGAFAVDPYGFILQKTLADGTEQASKAQYATLTAGAATVTSLAQGGFVQSVANSADAITYDADPYGLIFGRTLLDGTFQAAKSNLTPASAAVSGSFPYDLEIVIIGGQSLSRGYSANPPLSTTQPYAALMLSGGVWTYDTWSSGYGGQTLAPLIEQTHADPAGPAGDGETPASGFAATWAALIASQNGIGFDAHRFQPVLLTPGVSGSPLTTRIKGTTAYNRLLAAITRIVELAQAAGKTVACRVICEIGGESDQATGVTYAAYKAGLKQYRTDLAADIKAITGQPDEPQMFVAQMASLGTQNNGTLVPMSAYAQFDASVEDANIHLAFSPYPLTYAADGTHLTNTTSRLFGSYLARCAWEVVTRGRAWTGLRPLSKFVQGRLASITFAVPRGKLVLDTIAVADPGNYGFELLDSGGSPLMINSVVVTDNRVVIEAAATIPAGATIAYASKVTAAAKSGPVTGQRGNLRDSETLTAASGELLRNWAPIFKI